MCELPDPINEIAKRKFGIDYVFPYQRLVISNILRTAQVKGFELEECYREELSKEQIVLLPTGAGKSLCFMIPAFLLNGISIVVFPLLSLLSDQLRRTEEAGLPSAILRGGQSLRERDEIFRKCLKGEVKMILTNPETLSQSNILEGLKKLEISHIIIDETHTVSEWGDTFRPAYLELPGIITELCPELITAFTATASEHILKRIKEILFPHSLPNIVYGNPDRDNISYSVVKTVNPSYTLMRKVIQSEKPLIVFSSSRTGTELTARMLRRELLSDQIYFYHAGLEKEEKEKVEKWFFNSGEGILVATTAYGMGVDKKNIRTVIHMDLPPTVESYLQESGRAGRDRNPSKAILLFKSDSEHRLKNISDSLSRLRYEAMLDYGRSDDLCRREKLLAMLDSTPEICSGCDICLEEIETEPHAENVIRLISKNKGRFKKREFIYFLKGYKTRRIEDRLLHEMIGFQSFSHWSTDMIEEFMTNLIRGGDIRIPIKGFGKHRLTVQSYMNSSIKSLFGRLH